MARMNFVSPNESSAESPEMQEFENYRQQFIESTPWIGHVDAKVDAASPFNYFLSRVQDSRETYDEDLTITFPELLDSSFGELENSLHLNFMVELNWLLTQYAIAGFRNPPMTVMYDNIDQSIPNHLNAKGIRIQSPYPFGHHHTKMSIFSYKNKSLRICIYTANLVESDWENKTQGVWISPNCPYLGDNVPYNYGESETLFKHDIIKYLNSYHVAEMEEWLIRIQKADLSEIRVCLIPSVPGEITDYSGGYNRVQKLLRDYVPPDYGIWDFIVQCSSIGSLGPAPESWLYSELVPNLNNSDIVNPFCLTKVIFPTYENVRRSLEGLRGGNCLPYQSTVHQKQSWLTNFMFQWKCEHRHRTKAMPHVKSYFKLSPEGDKVAWFLLTSANLSKAAWGKASAAGKVKILSYELGILYLPYFLVGKSYFRVKKGGNLQRDNDWFPVPIDIPVTPYRQDDRPFLYDKCFGS